MQYMLLIYADENMWDAMPADERARVSDGFTEVTKKMAAAGILKGGAQLQRARTAATVRVRQGRHKIVDGPFAETKEHLGGYYLIDVPSLEEATQWAAQLPAAAMGSVEVRGLTERQSETIVNE
ncbi:YciI family protein [Massilia arenosa]|uniref:YciI family protein n=1 Tax=Zemynaea arenosa TaxID=2561931 RepID=A0A4Y9SS98_9BURK|nr:YciI family protein [Massilia arenosa]TFW29662.1 YciI family protein [Massilia arenosa]